MTAPTPARDRMGSVLGMPLSVREMVVMRRVAVGTVNKTIASDLHVSEQTVKNQVSSAMSKLGVTTRGEAVFALGWVHVPAVPEQPVCAVAAAAAMTARPGRLS